MERTWKKYVSELSVEDKLKLLDHILSYEMDWHKEAIYYTEAAPPEYPDEPPTEEGLRWSVCGELILKKAKK